jgi:hypothetical protein
MSTKLDLLMEEVIEPYDDFDLNGGEDDLIEGHYRKQKMESDRIFNILLIFILIITIYSIL